MNTKRYLIYPLITGILIICLGFWATGAWADNDKDSEDEELTNYLADYEAVVETSKGTFTISFLPDIAPAHVLNFISLAKTGFYDGLTFHRYVAGFVVQGGDPLGAGFGGPGYTLPAEISDQPLHIKGALGMARTGDDVNPDRRSSGSQFYICLEDVHRLDGKYTVWANVSTGMDIVANLRVGDTINKIRIRKIGNTFDKDVTAALEEIEKKATDPVTGLKYIDLKAIVKTSKGDFELGFYYAGAPDTVAKFVELAHGGFYDGMKFDRYEDGVVVECGADAKGTAVPFEFHPDYKHLTGAVGLPLASGEGDKEELSNLTRFYICLGEIPDLNGKQAIFAFVAKGMENVLELRVSDIIESITIVPLAETRHAGQ